MTKKFSFTKCQSPAFVFEGSRRVTRGATLGAFSTIKLPGVCSPFECAWGTDS